MSERRRRDPGALSPRQAADRYLRRRQSDATESTVYAYRYRLKLFYEWCQGVGIERVDELQGYDFDEYFELRASSVAPATLQGEMSTIKKFVEYLEQIDAVEDGLADSVRVPDVSDDDLSNEVKLDPADALPLLTFYRDYPGYYGTREHVLLELIWMTGARQGGIRALDVQDVYFDEQYVDFRHRPDTGTPLKNKTDGERPVALPAESMRALKYYYQNHRPDVHDDEGRQPFLASTKGRPHPNTVRAWSYLATHPCLHRDCPHGRERATCEFTEHAHASKCPSSRSPHQIRTGSIGWQRDCGLPPDVVAKRVNATLDVIEQHYDKTGPRERMERRRRPYVQHLTLELTEDEEDES